jgi:hypothetical protein
MPFGRILEMSWHCFCFYESSVHKYVYDAKLCVFLCAMIKASRVVLSRHTSNSLSTSTKISDSCVIRFLFHEML